MDVAALVTWLLTAGGGFVLLGTWIAKGGVRQAQAGQSRFPPALIFGHFVLAVVGLLAWIGYLISDDTAGLAWAAFVILLPVVLLGFTMLLRWLPGRRTGGTGGTVAAEQRFPVPVVAVHGLLAVATVVLVLLAALAAT